MVSYKFKYIRCNLEYIPNDVSIQITGYLTDTDDRVFINTSTLGIDTFTIQTYKSSLPNSGYDSFLSIIAGKFISDKYSSSSVGGIATANSNVISNISDTTNIIAGLYAWGSNIPAGTTVVNVRDKNSIEISNAATATGNITLSLSTHGWQIDYSQISKLTEIIDFSLL